MVKRTFLDIFAKTFIVLAIVTSNLQKCDGFDLVSTLLSQGSRLPLPQLKSMLSSPTVQRMLHSNGFPSLESLRGSDPSQIRKILNRLKPMQGRVDPQILELLAKAIGEGPPSQSSELPQPVMPPPRRKFSSKFRRRKTTTPIISSTEIPQNSGLILQFDQVDPNIGNHKLNGWRSQNFTTIDRIEDLMMDESFSQPPSLIPLLEDSNEVGNPIPTSSSSSGAVHWESSTTEATEEPPRGLTREPLQKSSSENDPVSTHFHLTSPSPTFDAQPHGHFRPSPVDSRHPPQFYEPGQDFYTSTIRNRMDHPYPRRPNPNRQYFPSMKQDRILSLGSDQGPSQGHGYGHGIQSQESKLSYHYAKPSYYPGNAYQGHPSHPFAHYKEIDTMYAPSHYHHNKYHYLNPNIEQELDQSPASDKNDGGWSNTFFLLGGIVAASALVAFLLPSILPSVTGKTEGKKESEGLGGATAQNSEFWNEVKGLYSDLTNLARGDFTHLDQLESRPGKDEVEDESEEMNIERTTSTSGRDDAEFADSSKEVKIRWRKQGSAVHRDNMATPVPIFPASATTNSRPLVGKGSSNNSFLTEWAKVQLKVIDA